MSDFVLSTCSTQDLSDEHCKRRNIEYVCFHFEIDEEQYPDDNGKTMRFKDFYDKMRAGSMTKTSQVNVDEYVNFFEPFLKEGKDILHISLSSGISGTVNSANIAKDMLEEKYPERKLYVVDSLAASSGLGLFVDKLADLRDEGKSIDEVRDWAEANKLKVHHWFFTSDLTYLIRGGRVSKTAGFVGKMLNICPLLNVAVDGSLQSREKIRGQKKTMERVVAIMEEHAPGGTDYTGKCFISQSDCPEDARMMADMIEAKFPKMAEPVEINYIGTTIGSHTGPGLIAVFFWGDERTN
jgi:DegV family protein with EDD domain